MGNAKQRKNGFSHVPIVSNSSVKFRVEYEQSNVSQRDPREAAKTRRELWRDDDVLAIRLQFSSGEDRAAVSLRDRHLTHLQFTPDLLMWATIVRSQSIAAKTGATSWSRSRAETSR